MKTIMYHCTDYSIESIQLYVATRVTYAGDFVFRELYWRMRLY